MSNIYQKYFFYNMTIILLEKICANDIFVKYWYNVVNQILVIIMSSPQKIFVISDKKIVEDNVNAG